MTSTPLSRVSGGKTRTRRRSKAMLVFNLIYEDGSGSETNHARTISGIEGVIRAIRHGKVETIVVGEVEDGKVLWEKQFSEVTVLPSSFGKPS